MLKITSNKLFTIRQVRKDKVEVFSVLNISKYIHEKSNCNLTKIILRMKHERFLLKTQFHPRKHKLFFADDLSTRQDLFLDGHRESSVKNNLRPRRQKHPKKQQKDSLARLDDSFIEKLDASCYGKLRAGKPVKPPLVNNAVFVKYVRFVATDL